MKRPAGVTAFAVLEIFFSIVLISSFVFMVVLFLLVDINKVYENENLAQNMQDIPLSPQQILTYGLFSGGISFFIGIVGLIAGIGLFKLKPWARKLLLFLAIFVIVTGTINLIVTSMVIPQLLASTFMGAFYGFIYYCIILWYFNKKEIKSVFANS